MKFESIRSLLSSFTESLGQILETKKVESTLVGLKYPTGRENLVKTGTKWLNGKKLDDGAEGLWRIGDKLYDLEEWTRNHPGGAEWITLTQGIDITEAFHVHHVTQLAEQLLPKFYVRDAVTQRASPFSFKSDGFYQKFKARAKEALKDVDFHEPSRVSKLIADSLFLTTLALCITTAAVPTYFTIVISGLFLSWTTVAGHNFMHQKNSFRMYYMDLLLLSSKEWRITHALSHHLYTNTLLDMEMALLEPFFTWLPRTDKGFIVRFVSWLYAPIVYVMIAFEQGIQRIYSVFWEWSGPEIRDAVPFLIPIMMCLTATPLVALWTWLKIIAVSGFYFGMIGVAAAHHHPDIFHDGDVHREDADWGLAQLDAVRDRVEIEASFFFVLTHFGTHSLHHLLPSIDHGYLHLCEPAFKQTCEEFGISTELWTQWELFKGQFLQLKNIEPKKVPNIRSK